MGRHIGKAAEELAEVMKIAYQRGLTTGGGGNASIRLERDLLAITPSGKFKGRLSMEDILLINMNGEVIAGNGRPSSEWRMHVNIYKVREDVGAILHCHPSLVTGLATSGINPPDPSDPTYSDIWTEESSILLGKQIRVIDRKPYGTEELAKAVAESLSNYDSNAVVIKSHGAVVVAKDIWLALSAMDSLVEIYTINFVRWLSERLA
ncbi:MAG: class II aldolase/adducin family protein [Candidatus Korarchaeota archaeon]|nr:class II aldolase/adducin family protein [Candidatus Korarchaeota archaeon]